MSPTRRPRADARRNYDRLLAEADAVFREHGTEASLESVARRAGVAIGTLYGHFPTRLALVGALLKDRNQALFVLGDELLKHPEPAQGLARWVRAVVEHAAAYSGLADLLAEGLDNEASDLHTACLHLNQLNQAVLTRARDAGAVRDEVTATDLYALVNAAAWTRDHQSPTQADRLVHFTLNGFRAAAG